MVSLQRHSIARENLRIHLGSEEEARMAFELFSDLAKNELPDLMCQVLDGLMAPDVFYSIPKVYIALGELDPHDLRGSFLRRFLMEFEAQVKSAAALLGPIQSPRRHVELLEAILLHGVSPWWASPEATKALSLQAKWQTLLEEEPAAAMDLLQAVIRSPEALKRLVDALPDDFLVRLWNSVAVRIGCAAMNGEAVRGNLQAIIDKAGRAFWRTLFTLASNGLQGKNSTAFLYESAKHLSEWLESAYPGAESVEKRTEFTLLAAARKPYIPSKSLDQLLSLLESLADSGWNLSPIPPDSMKELIEGLESMIDSAKDSPAFPSERLKTMVAWLESLADSGWNPPPIPPETLKEWIAWLEFMVDTMKDSPTFPSERWRTLLARLESLADSERNPSPIPSETLKESIDGLKSMPRPTAIGDTAPQPSAEVQRALTAIIALLNLSREDAATLMKETMSQWASGNTKAIRNATERIRLLSKHRKPEQDFPASTLYPVNCGLILLTPFLSTFFASFDLLDEDGAFLGEEAREAAVLLLRFVADLDPDVGLEELILPKLMCGMPVTASVDLQAGFPEGWLAATEELIQAVQVHWEAVNDLSPDGFRQAWLRRPGLLSQRDGNWLLQVERQTHDILMDSLPWSLTPVWTSWMERPMVVEW
ncbi:MAG: hypothetical protein RLZZ165_1110 [Bacteroidota bacterium]